MGDEHGFDVRLMVQGLAKVVDVDGAAPGEPQISDVGAKDPGDVPEPVPEKPDAGIQHLVSR